MVRKLQTWTDEPKEWIIEFAVNPALCGAVRPDLEAKVKDIFLNFKVRQLKQETTHAN